MEYISDIFTTNSSLINDRFSIAACRRSLTLSRRIDFHIEFHFQYPRKHCHSAIKIYMIFRQSYTHFFVHINGIERP